MIALAEVLKSKFTRFTGLRHCLENKRRGNGMENEGKGKCLTVL